MINSFNSYKLIVTFLYHTQKVRRIPTYETTIPRSIISMLCTCQLETSRGTRAASWWRPFWLKIRTRTIRWCSWATDLPCHNRRSHTDVRRSRSREHWSLKNDPKRFSLLCSCSKSKWDRQSDHFSNDQNKLIKLICSPTYQLWKL